MKKFVLLVLGLSIMSCSSDDDKYSESASQILTDPIIGVWQSQEGLFTATFNENGTLTISNGNMHPYDMFDSWCKNVDQTVTGFWGNFFYGRNFENDQQFYTIMDLCDEGRSKTYVYIFSNDFNTVSISGHTFVGSRQ